MTESPSSRSGTVWRACIREGVAVYCAFPPILVWGMVKASPFGSPESADLPASALFVAVGASLMAYLLFRAFVGMRRRGAALGLLAAYALATMAGDAVMGFLFHRDFFSAFFMHLIQAVGATLYACAFFNPRPINASSRRFLFSFALAASILWSAWLIMMGYAIATRAEPRRGESIVYNLYNAGLAGMLYAVCFRLSLAHVRSVRAERDRFMVDDIDFTPILGKSGCVCAYYLLNRRGRVSCADIASAEYGRDCAACSNTRASSCAEYRNIYNSVRVLRHLVEVMQLGGIESAEKKNRIVDEGWLFVPERLVRIEGGPTEPA
jgi:hypothetical protein